ncbi:DUF2849 domain-containing protein [Methylobrevis albus]|uniref:DUF2849 domain-containing protein n=1 Tax=Methylobrevis albus TaxID=2793297 RepID=A0A931I226_9HYPH|nr:DUF2849 domain-containing protein [Methylobrevis albus]MBH0238832.1 DUF2849 domain-containing protein [Methylobrevis albus]
MQQIVTGNRLIDGVVVFRGPGGSWVEAVDAAEVLGDDAASEAAFAAAMRDFANCVVVDVALIDVKAEAGHVVPLRLRERIRAEGPTVKSDYRPDLRPWDVRQIG